MPTWVIVLLAAWLVAGLVVALALGHMIASAEKRAHAGICRALHRITGERR